MRKEIFHWQFLKMKRKNIQTHIALGCTSLLLAVYVQTQSVTLLVNQLSTNRCMEMYDIHNIYFNAKHPISRILRKLRYHWCTLFGTIQGQLLTLWCESLEEGDENATHRSVLNICTKSKMDGNKTQFQQMDKVYSREKHRKMSTNGQIYTSDNRFPGMCQVQVINIYPILVPSTLSIKSRPGQATGTSALIWSSKEQFVTRKCDPKICPCVGSLWWDSSGKVQHNVHCR